MSDLKPCPFCGKEVGYDIRDAEGNLRDADYLLDPWSGVSYTIRHEHELSPDCPIASFSDEILGVLLFDNLDALHESWNTRVESPELSNLRAINAKLVGVLKESRLQIEYLHEKYNETGSGNGTIARIDAVIIEAEAKAVQG